MQIRMNKAKAISSDGQFQFEFDTTPFADGSCRNAYRGHILAPANRRGELVVIKLFKEDVVSMKRKESAIKDGLIGGFFGAVGGALLGAAAGWLLGSGEEREDRRDREQSRSRTDGVLKGALCGAVGGGALGGGVGGLAGYAGDQIHEGEWTPDVGVSNKAQEFANAYNRALAEHSCGEWRVQFCTPIVAKLEEPVCILL